jgi:hypothetical protein
VARADISRAAALRATRQNGHDAARETVAFATPAQVAGPQTALFAVPDRAAALPQAVPLGVAVPVAAGRPRLPGRLT